EIGSNSVSRRRTGMAGFMSTRPSPRREHPQVGDAKHNPGRYDLRRQSARRLAFAATLIRLPLVHPCTSEKNCSNNPLSSSGGPSLPSLMTGVATCAHHPPANSALLPLRDGGDDGARYVRFRGEPDIAGDVVQLLGTSGKNTGPRREHPQLSDAARNPGFYDFRRQGRRSTRRWILFHSVTSARPRRIAGTARAARAAGRPDPRS